MQGMTFQDLPRNAKNLSLTDRQLAADVIDLIIKESERAAGCIGLMLCDDHDRGIQPVVVNDVPADADLHTFGDLLDMVLPLVAGRGGSILVGRGRHRGRRPSDSDRAWHEVAIRACRRHGVRLLGFYLATADGVFPLPEPLQLVS